MGRLAGQTAVIVGGGRGLGRSVALTLGREGARVVVAARTVAEIECVAAALRAEGVDALAVPVDATRESDVEQLVRATREAYGTVDIVVNCAGEALIQDTFTTTWDDYRRILDANLGTAYLIARGFLPGMQQQGRGLLVNIASRAALNGPPTISLYRAAKAGLIAFTQALSQEARRHGVRVVVLSPAPMDTPMRWAATPGFDPRRAISPQLVAELVLMLAVHPDLTFEETVVPAAVAYY